MKKSKFLKSVAALTLGAVAAAGCISLAACGHAHSTTHDWEKNSIQHWHVCDEDGDEYDKANHDYGNGNECTVCHYPKPAGTTPGGEVQAHTYTYKYDAIVVNATCVGTNGTSKACPKDNYPLTQALLDGTDNSFLTITGAEGSSFTYRDGAQHLKEEGSTTTSGAPSCVEIKGEALTVTFQGTGTLKITVASTGKNNSSSFALKNSSGVNLTAAGSATGTDNVYVITGTSGVELTYTIEAAGTYTLYNAKTVGTANTDRSTRISALVMTDNY